jgi:hypothetical protein
VSHFLEFSDSSEILSIIISFIVDIFQISDPQDKNQFLLLHKIMKIFKKLIDNIREHYITDTGEKQLMIGRLSIPDQIIEKILSLHLK